MKTGIHPRNYRTNVTCSCGTTFQTTSTKRELRVEICSQCHPFYTGKKQMNLGKAGQVEKFNQRYKK